MEKQRMNLRPYLPPALVGGSIPQVEGAEEEGVWNAAAQACGTERVHYCYTVDDGRCWYLAVPSSALASDPDSWCPLAAALPGNSEHWDKKTVHIYESEGAAGALRWDPETGRMQIFTGASRTILPRIQSLEANFVTVNPEKAKIVPWKNRALARERLARGVVGGLFALGAAAVALSLAAWLIAQTLANTYRPRLDAAKALSAKASEDLMRSAADALQSNAEPHFHRIIGLLNTLGTLGGVLTRYEVKADNSAEWTALVPGAVPPGQLQATAVGAEDGRVRIKGAN